MSARGRVLIVGTDARAVESYRKSLRKAGFESAVADGGRAAARLLERDAEAFDLVLSEASMPTMDGVALLDAARKVRTDLPFVLLFDRVDNARAVDVMEHGAGVLVEPVTTDDLLRTVDAAIRSVSAKAKLLRARSYATSTVTATEAKNRFAHFLDKAASKGPIAITKHAQPVAFLIGSDEFLALKTANERRLDALRAEFDVMVAEMQTPAAKAAMRAAFDASPEEMGDAAAAAARKRR